MQSQRLTNYRRWSDEGVSTQTIISIVEAGITTIASIVYMLSEKKKDEKRQDLELKIEEAKRKLEKL